MPAPGSGDALHHLLSALLEPAVIIGHSGRSIAGNEAGLRLFPPDESPSSLWNPWPATLEPATIEALHAPDRTWHQLTFTHVTAGFLVVARRDRPWSGMYHAALQTIQEGVLIVDDEGIYVAVNDALCRMLRAPRERLVGAHFSDFIPPERLSDAAHAFAALKRNESTPVEFPLLTAEGTIVELEWTSRQGVLPGLHVCTCRDVTGLLEEAERLRRNEETMRLALESARIGTWYLDVQNPDRNYWSPEAYAIGGFESNWKPNYNEWLERVHPEDRERVHATISQALQPGGGAGYTIAYRIAGMDGLVRWHETRGRIRRDQHGTGIGALGITIDVTDAKIAEEQLRTAHAQLRAIVDDSPLPIVILNRSGDITLWNPAAERLFGWSEMEVLGKPLPFIPEARREEHRQMREQDLSGNTFHSRQITRERRDGTSIDLTVSTALLQDTEGQVTGILSMYSDVTEQQNLLRRLAETADRLTLSLEASGMGDWSWSAETDVVKLSRRAAEIFEIPPGPQITWRALQKLLHPEDQQRAAEEVERCVRQRCDYSMEYRVRSGQSSWRWIHAKGKPVFASPAGPLSGMIGVVQDVTSRRDSEAVLLRLHHREQQARQTAELLNRVGPAMLAELDPQRLVQQALDLAVQLTGAEYGSFRWSADTEHPHQAVSAGTAPVAPLSDLRIPVVSRSGQVLGELQFAHAQEGKFAPRHARIAAGIAAQAAIAIENARLFAEVDRKSRALEQMNQELRRSNEDLEHFAWSASHDLQEPLRQVATFSQLLRRRYGGRMDASADQFLEYIVQGALRMEALVRDILAYTHVSRGAFPDGEKVCDAAAVLDNVLATMDQSLRECGAIVNADRLPRLQVSDLHLERLLQNLLSNSVKYRGTAPLTVTMSAEPAEKLGYWHFRFCDTGIGIDPRYHKQIFALFRRLHSAAQYEGTGIGLAICSKIVERYSGQIWVESAVGEGATFHFTLPGTEADVQQR